jgi:fermentation-respiration switch protein FrsA (DUF1100 family)
MTRRHVKTKLLAVAALPAVLYLGVIGYFVQAEDSIVYRPSHQVTAVDKAFEGAVRPVSLRSDDGIRLSARVLPSRSGEARWIYFLPANAGNGSTYQRWWRIIQQTGANLLTIDYRGYGESDGRPSEAGLYRDATAGYRFLVEEQRVAPADIVLYGFSLGSAVAIDLAARVPVGGLIVEGAATSIPAVGQENYPFLPVSFIARNRFASIDKIAAVSCPTLFFHARGDRRVPFRHAERLYARANAPKNLVPLDGDHGTAAGLNEALIVSRVRAFLTPATAGHAGGGSR